MGNEESTLIHTPAAKKKIIVVVGSNASGKSSLAVRLAKQHGGEVISADSRQLYKGLDIATGKITKTEMQGVPHHFIDVVNPKTIFTAADFRERGTDVLGDMFARGKVPIIAGGTGFYIDALLGRAELGGTPVNSTLRAELEKKDPEELFAQLQVLDPRRAKSLEEKNEHALKRRIIRAIEIAKADTVAKKKVRPCVQNPSLDILWIGLRWPDDVLRARIHERTVFRMRRGMVAEARRLHEKGVSWKRMEQLGLEYRLLSQYLRGQITKEELIEKIDTGDWQYARRQRTWFRRNDEIQWFHPKDGLRKIEQLVEGFLDA